MKKSNSCVKKASFSGMYDLEDRLLRVRMEVQKNKKTVGKRLMLHNKEAFWNKKCTMIYEKLIMSTENAISWQIFADVFLSCVLSALNVKYSQRPNLLEKIQGLLYQKKLHKVMRRQTAILKDVWLRRVFFWILLSE